MTRYRRRVVETFDLLYELLEHLVSSSLTAPALLRIETWRLKKRLLNNKSETLLEIDIEIPLPSLFILVGWALNLSCCGGYASRHTRMRQCAQLLALRSCSLEIEGYSYGTVNKKQDNRPRALICRSSCLAPAFARRGRTPYILFYFRLLPPAEQL